MKFRKKPVVIDAVQITDEWFDADHPNDLIPCSSPGQRIIVDPRSRTVDIETLEGTMTGNIGDWIITGVKGECYPCKPDIFAETYEAV